MASASSEIMSDDPRTISDGGIKRKSQSPDGE